MTATVLICDDSALARKHLSRLLPDDWDATIRFAAHGAEALEVLEQSPCELLFLDLNMPVMDGYATLQALGERGIDTPVIAVSGDVQADTQRRARSLGALGFLEKPADAERVRAVLDRTGISRDAGGSINHPMHQSVGTLDGIQEMANVAMGRAAEVLARLLDVFIVLPLPKVRIVDLSELRTSLALGGEPGRISGVCQGFTGGRIAGEAILLFSDSSFNDMARLMHYEGERDDAMELELLMDTANVMIGACLANIAEQLNVHLHESTPALLGQHDDAETLFATGMNRWQRTLAVEIEIAIENHAIDGDLMLLFTEDSIDALGDYVKGLG